MLLDSILKLHDKIENMKLGKDRQREITELEDARLSMQPLRLATVQESEL
jgi:NADH-quinone oxidoreductase subunit B